MTDAKSGCPTVGSEQLMVELDEPSGKCSSSRLGRTNGDDEKNILDLKYCTVINFKTVSVCCY